MFAMPFQFSVFKDRTSAKNTDVLQYFWKYRPFEEGFFQDLGATSLSLKKKKKGNINFRFWKVHFAKK